MASSTRVTTWNEYRHEKNDEHVTEIYPEGIHGTLAAVLKDAGLEVRTATLDEPEHGLPEEVLNTTDVLLWWGHLAHEEVSDETVERVHERVLGGMGLVVLHSGHFSKIFKKLMGTTCDLSGATTTGSASGSSRRAIPSPRGSGSTSSLRRRCTGSPSTCPSPTSSSS